MSTEVNKILNNLASHPISQFMQVSGVTLLLTDWLFTLDREIAYAWTGAWNMGQVLYFLTRYSAFLDTPIMLYLYYNTTHPIPPTTCALLYTAVSAIGMFGIAVAEVIMTIRVWALWGRRKDIGIPLIVMSIVDIAATVVTYTLIGWKSGQYIVIDSIPGCFIVNVGPSTVWYFIPLLVHQTLIITLTVIKGVQHYQGGVYSTSLVNTFYRDGITYYALLITFSFANLDGNDPRSSMEGLYFFTLYDLQRITHSILSARMLLHLREDSDASQNRNSKPPTPLRFAAAESPGDPSSTPISQLPEGANIPNGGWFGQEESPSHHSHHSHTTGLVEV